MLSYKLNPFVFEFYPVRLVFSLLVLQLSFLLRSFTFHIWLCSFIVRLLTPLPFSFSVALLFMLTLLIFVWPILMSTLTLYRHFLLKIIIPRSLRHIYVVKSRLQHFQYLHCLTLYHKLLVNKSDFSATFLECPFEISIADIYWLIKADILWCDSFFSSCFY